MKTNFHVYLPSLQFEVFTDNSFNERFKIPYYIGTYFIWLGVKPAHTPKVFPLFLLLMLIHKHAIIPMLHSSLKVPHYVYGPFINFIYHVCIGYQI